MFHYDGKKLIIGNFLKIKSIENKCIIIVFKRYNLIVMGKGLFIPYLEDREISVEGIIESINIQHLLGDKNDKK